jgi:hypothetical protein
MKHNLIDADELRKRLGKAIARHDEKAHELVIRYGPASVPSFHRWDQAEGLREASDLVDALLADDAQPQMHPGGFRCNCQLHCESCGQGYDGDEIEPAGWTTYWSEEDGSLYFCPKCSKDDAQAQIICPNLPGGITCPALGAADGHGRNMCWSPGLTYTRPGNICPVLARQEG